MSKLLKALEKNDLAMFSEKLTNAMNSKKDAYLSEAKEKLSAVLFTENLITEDPVLVSEDDEFDNDVEYFYDELDEEVEIEEGFKRVIKINSKGKKRIKKMCGKGFKLVDNKCVKQDGNDKATMRKSQRKRGKTLKANTSIIKKRTRLTKRAMKQRKARGA